MDIASVVADQIVETHCDQILAGEEEWTRNLIREAVSLALELQG